MSLTAFNRMRMRMKQVEEPKAEEVKEEKVVEPIIEEVKEEKVEEPVVKRGSARKK